MELFGIFKNLSKNFVSLIVKIFVCQAVKKNSDIEDFIEEQDLETLTRLCGDDCKEYSTDVSEESYNVSDFDEFLDLVMEDINNSQE